MDNLRIPPHSIDAEAAFLSAVFERNTLIEDCEQILKESDFYNGAHKTIYRRMCAMAFAGQPIDPITLCTALESAGEAQAASSPDYVIQLATEGRGAHNAMHYAKIISERAMDRDLISKGVMIADLGYSDGDPLSKLDEAQKIMMESGPSFDSEVQSGNQVLQETLKEIQRLASLQGALSGVTSGYTDLDKITNGFQAGDMIVVAGRPSMGKTTFAMNCAEAAIDSGELVLVFSLEMPARQLMLRMISSRGRIPLETIKRGNGEEQDYQRMTAGAAKIKDRPIYIDDTSSLTSERLLSRARKLQKKAGKKIGMIIIDYLQLLADKGEGVDRVTKISRNMKLLAKEIDCPVLALSQLSRKCEERGDQRPISSDLRDSGAIEQDADLIIMAYRDEVVNKNSQMPGVAEFIIRKHRNGELGTVYLKSSLHICRFDNNLNYMPPTELPQGRKYRSMD